MLVGDGYLRLHPARDPIHSDVPGDTDALVFVDLDTHGEVDPSWLAKQIRGAKPGFFLAARHILVRWPQEGSDSDLREQARAIATLVEPRAARRPVPVGIVAFTVGEHPQIIWADETTDTGRDMEFLARARRAETYWLLRLGRGIWHASNYHYRLPSGEHSNTFVRVNDAFQRPRDPVVFATWLYPHLNRDAGVGILIDSPTLVPLVAALHSAAGTEVEPGEVAILTDYPSAQFEIDDAVEDLQANPYVLAVLSVSSSGSSRHRIANALSRFPDREWALETIVTRSGAGATELSCDKDPKGDQGAWLSLRGDGVSYRTGEDCKLCKTHSAAPTVFIDPRSFEAMALPQPRLLVPGVMHASDVKDLWEFYNEADAIGVQCRPHPQTAEVRGNRDVLSVRCFPLDLLDNSRFDDHGHRFRTVVQNRARKVRAEANEWDPALASIVVTTEEDRYDYPPTAGDPRPPTSRFDQFLEALSSGFSRNEPWPSDQIVTLPRQYTTIPEEFHALLRNGPDPKEILVVTVGAVTGNTMEQILVGLHDVTEDRVGGIIVHARPEREREWRVLSNAYNHQLGALWLTYLPWTSPFDDESKDLPRFADAIGSVEGHQLATQYVEQRQDLCVPITQEWKDRIGRLEATAVDPYAVLWGMPIVPPGDLDIDGWTSKAAPNLRPGSRFGHRSRALTTFAAVGGAVQWAREHAKVEGAPVWQQFEMPAVLRSYFDPPIIASVLRWLSPHETWWGPREGDAWNVIAEALARGTSADLKILLPEFMLAAIQGKVPSSAHDALLGEANHFIDLHQNGRPAREGEEPWTEAEIAPVMAAAALLRSGGPFNRARKSVVEDLRRVINQAALSTELRPDRARILLDQVREFDIAVLVATDEALAARFHLICALDAATEPAKVIEDTIQLLADIERAFG